MKSQDLRDICWFDIRKLRRQEGRLDDFFGIQRELSTKRVNEIKQYVRNIDATFPTGVIIAVDEVCASLSSIPIQEGHNGKYERFALLTLSNYPEPDDEADRILFKHIARVIDGQHRIAGLEEYELDNFEINVVIFIGADLANQASIFATVNLAQTKVNRSLVYDLFSLSENRSPQKTCHEIVVLLDREKESPFFKRIKRLGVATEGRYGETLSQATFVKALLKHISKSPAQDQEVLKRGKKLPLASPDELAALIFRNFFVRSEDEAIALIVWNYFDAVRRRWPRAWASTGTGNILNRTNGFNGFMRFLRPTYRHFTTSDAIVSVDDFFSIFKMIAANDDQFVSANYNPGTSGETAIYNDLIRWSGIEE